MFFALKILAPRIRLIAFFFSFLFISLFLCSCGPALPTFDDDLGRVQIPSTSPYDEPSMVVDAASGALVRPAVAAVNSDSGTGAATTLTYSGISN